MILIVTNRQDQTADYLILELKKRNADYVRFNTEDFPQKVVIDWGISNQSVDGKFLINDRDINFSQIASIWYRRPVSPVLDCNLGKEEKNFVIAESLTTVDGIWKTLDCFWVSNPDNIRKAENKLHQLTQASQVGFNNPQTLVTNNPESSTLFYETHEKDIIYKPLRKGRLSRGENQSVIFTNPVDRDAAGCFQNVKNSPSLFQKYISKRLELRITVMGDKVFAVSIDSQKYPKAIHDWRKALHDGIPHNLFSLPSEIETKCKLLVKKLGLEFGAIDMIITPAERFIFLEINPNGQWAWIQQMCPELPLRETLADILEFGQ